MIDIVLWIIVAAVPILLASGCILTGQQKGQPAKSKTA